MKTLFYPAIALMNKLSYTKKFMVIWLIHLIAIVVVLFGLYESLSQVSRNAQRELEGIVLIQPIMNTVQLMQQHRGLSAALLGGIDALRPDRAAKSTEVTLAINALKNKIPASLMVNQNLNNLESNWNSLQTEGLNWNLEDNFRAHTRLIDDLLDFVKDMTDQYYLTLDPDFDSYYLIDTIAWTFPRALERLGQIRAYGGSILAIKQLSEHQKSTLLTLMSQLDDSLKILVINLDKTGRANLELQVQLLKVSQDISSSIHEVEGVVRSDIISSIFSTSPVDFIKNTTEVIDRNYSKINVTMLPTLKALINARLERANFRLRINITIAILLLLLTYYFFIGGYYAISNNIQRLARSALILADGDLTERVELNSHDELTQVADSFNVIADSFQALLNAHTEIEDRLLAITNNTQMVIFMKDVSGRYLHVNRRYEELFHLNKDAIIGKTDHDLFPQEIADGVCKNDQQVIQSELPITLEELIPQDDGIHIYSSIKFPLRKVSGEIYAVCGIATDITAQQQAEQTLQKSELFYRAILDSTPDAMLLSDEQGIITLVNRQAEHLFGFSTIELIGESVDMLVPERLHVRNQGFRANYMNAPMIRCMSAGMDVLALRKDGSEFDVEISLSPIQTERGLFIAFALRDISQRKQLENQLIDSEKRFRHMADASPAMIWITDVNGNPIFVNQTWLNFTGIERVEGLSHQGWAKVIHPDDRMRIFRAYYQNIQDYSPILTEYRLRDRNGEWRWILDQGIPLHDDKGVFTGYIGSAIDITERKAAETDLRVAAVAFESQESIMITDATSVILRINKAFTETTGYETNEIIGKTPSLLKSGRHSADFYAEMWETLRDTGTWQGEIYDRRKNGEIYPKFLTISAVKGDNGNVTHYVGTHLDITISKAATAEIERLAFYDPLTELPNRRLLQDRLKLALTSSNRSGRKGALLFIDMDNFKTLNDTLGHDMGDVLLQQVGQRLESCTRNGDTVARLGGDEFVVMLEYLSMQDLEAATQTEHIGNKILAILNQPYDLALRTYHCTPSIGAVLFHDHDRTIEELLKQADIAMYQAKASGRNTLRFFDPQMQLSIDALAEQEADLRLALAEKQFILYYQAQVDHNHQVIGAEVLIRWQHPRRGLISPLDFIPLAEETGLILPVGQWVLETACAQIKRWENTEQTKHLKLAVNVSAKQFHQADFVKQVSDALHLSDINPARLKLELTETLVLDNIAETIHKMNAMRELGVLFSMDDFGTGYSSLAYLTQLPLTQLKIDQSFVRNIGVKATDAVIVQTIIGMGQNLGLAIIAEGVETEQQRDFLQQNGCLLFQGYLFSKPVPIEQFELLLKQG